MFLYLLFSNVGGVLTTGEITNLAPVIIFPALAGIQIIIICITFVLEFDAEEGCGKCACAGVRMLSDAAGILLFSIRILVCNLML